jgi:hypothetical protein
MTTTPAGKLFAGFLLFLGSISQVHAQGGAYTPEQMLDPRLAPKQDNVILSTPSAEELKTCSVAPVPGAGGKSVGFLLMDANKKPLRRFYDSKGAGTIDVWSYYKDGVEVYREFDTTYKGKANNFRWLNAGGMKWGVGGVDPATGRGFITSWAMISAEEAAFEAFQAVAKQDFARLQTLFISDKDMQGLKLPATQATRIAETQQQAAKKFSELTRGLNLAAAKFEIVEGAVPSCDTSGDVETIRYASRAIRYEVKGEHKWIHTGEMIRIGMAWRFVDVPSDKDPGAGTEGGVAGPKAAGSPELEAMLKLLADHDLKPPPPANILANHAEVHKYYEKRIDLVQKIVRLDAPEQREGWYKQLFDNHTAAAQNSGDDTALKNLKDTVLSQMPGTNLAAYGVYRHAWTRYAIDTFKSGDDQKKIAATQDKWLDDLTEFVSRYSKAEDTPEALHQLAIGCEFGGQTAKAKRWYTQLAENYPNHNLATRSRGSVARLDLVGNAMKLAAPRLDTGAAFDIGQLKGKLVIVHYWRSQNSDQYKDDFARLKQKLIGGKQDLELVSINLDDDAASARDAVAKCQAPGIHLYQAPTNNTGGGLNSALATQYGIHILPTLFLVNRDGRVTANALQIGDIETELRKVQ